MTFLTKLLGRKKNEQPKPSAAPTRSRPHHKRPQDAELEVQEAMLLRGLTDEAEYHYRLSLARGDMVDAQDHKGRWRPAEIVKATGTHVHVRWVDTGKEFELSLHKGGGRIAHPLTRSAAAAATTAKSSSSSPRAQQSSAASSAPPSRLSVSATMAVIPTSAPPLTPMPPSTVDFSITSSCILHQPPPPLLSPSSPGSMLVIPMAKDNSCLYHSIAYVCDGKKSRHGLHVMQQRLRAHALVTADPTTYSSVILGSEPQLYCRRLLDPATWGGAIELGLFSSLYECEIFAFDFTRPTVYRFGDMHGYEKRVFLVYSGSHYEALCYQEGGSIQESFQAQDDEALRRAQLVVEEMVVRRKGGSQRDVVWAGQGLYELRERAKQLVTNLLSPRSRRRMSAPTPSPQPQQQRRLSQPPEVNPGLPRMHSISVPTPLSSTARRSFTFGMTGRPIGLQSPPPIPPHPRSSPAELLRLREGARERETAEGAVQAALSGRMDPDVAEGAEREEERSDSIEQPGMLSEGEEEEKQWQHT